MNFLGQTILVFLETREDVIDFYMTNKKISQIKIIALKLLPFLIEIDLEFWYFFSIDHFV